MNFDNEVEARLLRYVQIDTQSDENSPTSPSTARQLDLSRILLDELTEIGAEDIELTEYGTVLATVPATTDGPTIGWLAHVDTAPAFNATGVQPIVHRKYAGGALPFPDAPDLVLSPEDSPYLAERIGDDIITASGTTLLGADDKSGIAVAMTAARHLIANPDIKRGKIRLAFTPDEEIGRGVHADLPKDLGADFAYTFDSAERGRLEYESFSADAATVQIEGVSVHPGTAKDMLVNALHLGAKIISTLPLATMTPETTDGRDGFIMVYSFEGSAAAATLKFILRDFEREGLAAKGALLTQICETVHAAEPRAKISCEIRPQYRNMRYWLEEDMAPVDLARDAYRACGLEPFSVAIRGGTDGSRLTEMGVPTPNLFTGMKELHGPREWISVQDMSKATEVAIKLAELAAR